MTTDAMLANLVHHAADLATQLGRWASQVEGIPADAIPRAVLQEAVAEMGELRAKANRLMRRVLDAVPQPAEPAGPRPPTAEELDRAERARLAAVPWDSEQRCCRYGPAFTPGGKGDTRQFRRSS